MLMVSEQEFVGKGFSLNIKNFLFRNIDSVQYLHHTFLTKLLIELKDIIKLFKRVKFFGKKSEFYTKKR